MKSIKRTTLSLATALFCAAAVSAEPEADATIEIEAGAQYDSTLAVTELDQVSSRGDWASVFNARLGGRLKPTERVTLKGSYRYGSRDYRQFQQFDQDLHTLALDGSVKLAGTKLGLSHHRARALLASDRFLDLTKTSLYAGRLFDNGLYLRSALADQQKTFANNPGRDSDGLGAELDFYYFPDGAGRYWYLGLGGETEDAQAPRFDNRALSVKARYSHEFVMLDREQTIQLGWRFQDRDYDNTDPQLQTERQDRRHTVNASWTLELNEYLALESEVEYGDYQSNLEVADYDETSASVLLRAAF